jgi:hypothetical protein
MGDLLVWSAKNNLFGYQKVTVKNSDTVTLILSLRAGKEYSENFDFVPPPEVKVQSTISDSLKKINAERFSFEDKMRANYELTFIDSAKTYRLSHNLKINADTLWMILQKTRGNWRDIINFISLVPEDQKKWIFPLLLNISEKDLRDVNADVLTDNLPVVNRNEPVIKDVNTFSQYILSPRIDNEFLKPFKGLFRNKFGSPFIENSIKDPGKLIDWIKNNIRIDNDANYGRAPITPAGVYELKVSDAHSRDIFFVAVCRSFGIPARLEPATKTPQYLSGDKWIDVWFTRQAETISEKGTLVLENDNKNDRKPEYYIHFTIENYKDGFYRSLDYEYDPLLRTFPCTLPVNSGAYLMVTGSRIAGGTVLAKLDFFNVEPGKTKEMTITLRKEMVPSEIFGKLNRESFFEVIKDQGEAEVKPGKGMIIAWLDPLTEPSRHFVADLISGKEEFDKWNGTILLFFKSEREKSDFINKNRKVLPRTISYLITTPQAFDLFRNSLNKPLLYQLPVVTYINRKSDIAYLSEGYRIGTGNDLLRLILADEKP